MFVGNFGIDSAYVGSSAISAMYQGSFRLFPPYTPTIHTLTLSGPSTISATTCQYNAVYDTTTVTSLATWSIISGSSYATISNAGLLTILSNANNSPVKISISYSGMTSEKDVVVTYAGGSSMSSETETHVHTDQSGNTTTTVETTTTITDGSGNTTTIISTNEYTENVDGTSVNTETQTTENPDGTSTSESTSTTYNSEGDPLEKTNSITDTEGNVSTQGIEYNEQGQETVTGYTIDTSNNPESGKTFNGDGVNTDYYAFDITRGFILNFHFTINYTDQPPGQNEGHHNILSMKRTTPEPWYGFQLRQSNNNKYILIGTQFIHGSNINTNFSGTTIAPNVQEFDLRITYDPRALSNSFVCYDVANDTNIFTSNEVFPDIDELKYLRLTIGYAMDPNGDPYRYSNINVINFSIEKLPLIPEPPVIYCDGENVTMTCQTFGAQIYYKLNQALSYSLYSSPIPITADTNVLAYSVKEGQSSTTVSATCIYDDGIEEPVITCDGEYVTIACDTPGADVHYRLGGSGAYGIYDFPFLISATTLVEAYSTIDDKTSETVSATCQYVPVVLADPVISCDGLEVTITCVTTNSEIYYRLHGTGNFSEYYEPIPISADTLVEAYSVYNIQTSNTVSATCEYTPAHDYSKDYLTFRVLTNGTIAWTAFGSGYNKAIQYSVNNGTWTSITASTTAPTIAVSAGDVVRFKGTNTVYAGSKANYDGFEGGTAEFDIEGNIMSLVYGDNFTGSTSMTGTYNFCSIFKKSNVISAEHLVLPSTTLTSYCYRAMFSLCPSLLNPPALPATTLAQGCYWYMFEKCPMEYAPDLLAKTLVRECYGNMFTGCANLSYIKCMANSGLSVTSALTSWVKGVAATGTFIKDGNTTWSTGDNGIPRGWTIYNDNYVEPPTISFDGEEIEILHESSQAEIYYRLNQIGSYTIYTLPISISANTVVETYAEISGVSSTTVTQTCVYSAETPYQKSNKTLGTWTYNGQTVTTPYSVNAIDGHSSSYAKGTFNFETSVSLRATQPTYLWFQHADQSATVYVDDTYVEKHWGGYTAFFVDLTGFAHRGTNNIKVALKNNEGNNLAPAAGDFNFNATLGNVKLFTSPVLPAMEYGYDGFHITSVINASASSATITLETNIPSGAQVVFTIDDGSYNYTMSGDTDGSAMTFTHTISNPHLWDGKNDPHLYNITMEIYKDGDLYHSYTRPYGLRYYEYVINQTGYLSGGQAYTGFLLNGNPYYLRGVCMHDDIDGKANALSQSDIDSEFEIVNELGCNFLRLAHYPHPKEIYDKCDELGIIVQTEAPCVNKLQSTMPSDYYTHLDGQYSDMVNQHYNHPSIVFWGLSNETTTDDKTFAKDKIEHYTSLIRSLDSERLVGYVMSHSYNDPSAYYNNPNVDWFGGNIYVGWYIDKASNDPTSQLNIRVKNIITNKSKPLAFSEYGGGGTQHCHSEDPQTTTTKGNYERHDIEYQMWLHEGHIAAIRNFPQLIFTAEWQLFDIAVANRNEGYTICLDGETTSTDDNLRRLNNKGLVERDHVTKKDTFYIYKAEWNPQKFVHICGKDYTRMTDRVIKCYTNDGGTLTMYVNGTSVGTATVTDHIATFASRTFQSGDLIRVQGSTANDSFTFS